MGPQRYWIQEDPTKRTARSHSILDLKTEPWTPESTTFMLSLGSPEGQWSMTTLTTGSAPSSATSVTPTPLNQRNEKKLSRTLETIWSDFPEGSTTSIPEAPNERPCDESINCQACVLKVPIEHRKGLRWVAQDVPHSSIPTLTTGLPIRCEWLNNRCIDCQNHDRSDQQICDYFWDSCPRVEPYEARMATYKAHLTRQQNRDINFI